MQEGDYLAVPVWAMELALNQAAQEENLDEMIAYLLDNQDEPPATQITRLQQWCKEHEVQMGYDSEGQRVVFAKATP